MPKFLHRLLVLLIFISAASAAYIFSDPKENNPSPPLSVPTNALTRSTSESLIPTQPKNSPNNPPQNLNKNTKSKAIIPAVTSLTNPSTSSPTAENQVNTISTTFIINNKEHSLKVAPGTSVYRGMIQLQEEKQISFSSKKFSSLGYFIEEINGVKNNPSAGFYWTLYINNDESKVGVSNYIIKSNDIITWRYENK